MGTSRSPSSSEAGELSGQPPTISLVSLPPDGGGAGTQTRPPTGNAWSEFRLSVQGSLERIVTVAVCGDLDCVTAPQLPVAVAPLLDAATQLVVDLAGVTILDAAGLAALGQVHRMCRQQGRQFVLVLPPAERVPV
ncbi:MAG: STAS domain-containing protein [Actinomycetota bacterium]